MAISCPSLDIAAPSRHCIVTANRFQSVSDLVIHLLDSRGNPSSIKDAVMKKTIFSIRSRNGDIVKKLKSKGKCHQGAISLGSFSLDFAADCPASVFNDNVDVDVYEGSTQSNDFELLFCAKIERSSLPAPNPANLMCKMKWVQSLLPSFFLFLFLLPLPTPCHDGSGHVIAKLFCVQFTRCVSVHCTRVVSFSSVSCCLTRSLLAVERLDVTLHSAQLGEEIGSELGPHDPPPLIRVRCVCTD